MAHLPVIVSFGGINGAGRGSGFHAYKRLVQDQLDTPTRAGMLQNLAALTGELKYENGQWLDGSGSKVDLAAHLQSLESSLLENTLIRKLNSSLFDCNAVHFHKQATIIPKQVTASNPQQATTFTLRRKQLPSPIPPGWQVTDGSDSDTVDVTVSEPFTAMLHASRECEVKCAGQLPTGFDPAKTYSSRNHPRSLQMTVFGASDAIQSLGIEWELLKQLVPPDKISVYAGSCLGQLDYNGNGGMLQARLLGKKVTSKQLPLGLNEMPADFINAYLLGNLGTTGHNNGACATFLYNLRQGIRDIQSGSHRISIVGTSESSMVPEVFDAFITMGALASDASLRALDGKSSDEEPEYRRACRPFANNSGFTVAESAQFIVLFDDQLALETGANIYGAVNDVFVNADGHKKSITGPGLGNYLTMSKAAAATRNVIGEQSLREATFVQAHGTGTPQNRVTEAAILNKVANTFGISNWPVAAVKSYLGHSVASAAGDQLLTSLGVWRHGIIPGILTVDSLAEDVERSNLDILLQHKSVGETGMDAVIINSKGFGGNNASASVLAPHITKAMLEKRHGKASLKDYEARNEKVKQATNEYDAATSRGEFNTVYKFDHNVMDESALQMDSAQIKIENHSVPVDLALPNPYEDMCNDS